MDTEVKILPSGVRTGAPSLKLVNNTYDARFYTLVAQMTALGETPTIKQQNAMGVAIRALRDIGMFETQWDVFVVTRGYGIGSTKLNWITNAYNATGVNSPTRADNAGYESNASNMALRTNYIPLNNGVLFTVNNASFFVRVTGNVATQGASKVVIGSLGTNDSGNPRAIMFTQSNSGVGFNSTGNPGLSEPPMIAGYNAISRDNASTINFYNATNSTTRSLTSSFLSNKELYVLANNWANTINYYLSAGAPVEIYAIGKSLTPANYIAISNIMNTYFSTYV